MQGLPAAIVMQLAVVLLQQFGYSNATTAFLSSLFILPWALKILLSPLVAAYGRQATWLVAMQFLIAVTVLCIAMIINLRFNLIYLSVAFLCLAFFSSTNDIVTDGLYLTQLPNRQQKFYIGLRTIFYQGGNYLCGGFALALIAWVSRYTGVFLAWCYFFIFLASVIMLLAVWHYWVFVRIKTPVSFANKKTLRETCSLILNDVRCLPNRFVLLGLIFVYNIPAAIQMKLFPLFFLDKISAQGLGFSANYYSVIASIGISAMLSAVFASGWMLLKLPLKSFLIIFNLLYAVSFLPFIYFQHTFLNACWLYMLNQFLFGLVNTGYMLLLVVSARNCQQPMVLYAVFTTLMMLCYAVFGMCAGFLQSVLHYAGVFSLLTVLTVLISVSILVLRFID
jgi:PAT family beta-lactamase induction signal transducer AmpG